MTNLAVFRGQQVFDEGAYPLRFPATFAGRRIMNRIPFTMSSEDLIVNQESNNNAFPEGTFLYNGDKPFEVWGVSVQASTSLLPDPFIPIAEPAPGLNQFWRLRIRELASNRNLTKNAQLAATLTDQGTNYWLWREPYTILRTEGFEVAVDNRQENEALRTEVSFFGYVLVLEKEPIETDGAVTRLIPYTMPGELVTDASAQDVPFPEATFLHSEDLPFEIHKVSIYGAQVTGTPPTPIAEPAPGISKFWNLQIVDREDDYLMNQAFPLQTFQLAATIVDTESQLWGWGEGPFVIDSAGGFRVRVNNNLAQDQIRHEISFQGYLIDEMPLEELNERYLKSLRPKRRAHGRRRLR